MNILGVGTREIHIFVVKSVFIWLFARSVRFCGGIQQDYLKFSVGYFMEISRAFIIIDKLRIIVFMAFVRDPFVEILFL